MSEYDAQDDFAKSLDVGYAAVRERVAAGGEPWTPKAPDPFRGLPRGHYGAILADPPWHFQTWAGARKSGAGIACRASKPAYNTMVDEDLAALPVLELAAPDCVLFLWTCWPVLERSFERVGVAAE